MSPHYIVKLITCLTVFLFPLIISVPVTIRAQDTGQLVLNEISPWPSDGTVWVELLNPSDDPVLIDGWSIEFVSGFSFEFPDSSGEVSGGGLHKLNIGGDNPLDPEGDGCILSSPDGPVDAVTWGQFTQPEALPFNFGRPVNPEYGFIGANRDLHEPDDVVIRLPVAWEDDLTSLIGTSHWIYRSGDSATPGEHNPPPPPVYYSPSDGAYIASDFMLVVEGFDWTSETTFQVATDEQFQDVVIEETVTGYSIMVDSLEGGTYYWRVRGNRGEPCPWTGHLEFTRADFDIEELLNGMEGEISSLPGESGIRIADHKGGLDPETWFTSYHAIPIVHDTQRKDTMMVCLDGCNMTGTYPWDNPQPTNDDSNASHGCSNCGMASLKMMASAHGCSVSQDRIAYYMMEEAGTASHHAVRKGQIGNPWEDLNHGVDGGLDSEDCPLLVSWLYNQPASASQEVFYNSNTFYNNSPAMDSIAEFIADNRPVLRHMATHTNLIAGAAVLDIPGIGEMHFVKVHDTNVMGNILWIDIDSTSGVYNEFTFPPTTGRMTRNDEPEIQQDSDEDGLVDFDEIHRLHTDPNDVDTDGDNVNDKQDMLGYLFTRTGEYLKSERDFDNDGAAKELDPDNDDPNDNSAWDGCEDIDHDGFVTPNTHETTCFNVNDDFDNVNPECFRGYIKLVIDVDRAGPDYTLQYDFLEMVVIEAGVTDPEAFVHEHKWDYHLVYRSSYGNATAHHNDSGLARIRLDYEPSTMEYFLLVEANTPPITITPLIETPDIVFMMFPPPSIYWFDRDERWPLGPAQVVDGGLLVKGEFEMEIHLFSWEIWIEPPS